MRKIKYKIDIIVIIIALIGTIFMNNLADILCTASFATIILLNRSNKICIDNEFAKWGEED